jgi:hypothetical protein
MQILKEMETEFTLINQLVSMTYLFYEFRHYTDTKAFNRMGGNIMQNFAWIISVYTVHVSIYFILKKYPANIQ